MWIRIQKIEIDLRLRNMRIQRIWILDPQHWRPINFLSLTITDCTLYR
jgi:hypothetical protein